MANLIENIDLSIVDIETTGINPAFDRVIEVAAFRVRNGEVIDQYSTLVDPEKTISYHIERLTGITNKHVKGAPLFKDIKDRLFSLLDGTLFVAHNARFDYGFLRNEFEREHIGFSAKCLCTARLSRLLFPEHRRHNLDSIIQRFGFTCENRHRATGDAMVLCDFLKAIHKQVNQEVLDNALAKLLERPTLPALLDEAVVEALPESPGVYTFYGQAGETLYVGKSVNIRRRVLSHFLNDRDSSKEMALCWQVADVKHITTAGELGASLKEMDLIKELSPFFNRNPKARKKLTVAKKDVDSNGYFTCTLDTLDSSDIDPATILGIFTSKKQAQDALWEGVREYNLCPGTLKLEKSEGPCSYTQLDKCLGACTASEAPGRYNARFVKAFAATKLKPWPFPSAILIEERSRNNGNERDVFVVDKWSIVGWLRYDECGVRNLSSSLPTFDYEHYKILTGHLSNGRMKSPVKLISREELDRLLGNCNDLSFYLENID